MIVLKVYLAIALVAYFPVYWLVEYSDPRRRHNAALVSLPAIAISLVWILWIWIFVFAGIVDLVNLLRRCLGNISRRLKRR